MCVSLIQASIFTLGQILQLLLQSFMTLVTSPQDSADSAGVLQLFLETYFTELLGEDAERTMDADQQQVPGPLILGGKQLFEEGAHLTGSNTHFCRESNKCRDYALCLGEIIKFAL